MMLIIAAGLLAAILFVGLGLALAGEDTPSMWDYREEDK